MWPVLHHGLVAGVRGRECVEAQLARGEWVCEPSFQLGVGGSRQGDPLRLRSHPRGAALAREAVVLARGRGVHLPLAADKDGVAPPPHDQHPGSAQAVVGRGRLSLLRRPAPQAAAPRFDRLVAKYAGRHLGAHDGVQRARALLSAAYTNNTQRTYLAAWDRFAAYCREENLRALPAHYTTMAGYVGRTHARGTVSASSMGSYLSLMDTIHELAGYKPPTAHPIPQRLRNGYLRLTAAGVGAIPEYVGPLPAEILHKIVTLGVNELTPEQRRVWAGLVLAGLIFNRPGAAAAMRAADLTFTPQWLHVQQAFHKSEARTRARSDFLIPVHPAGYASDPPLLFLRAYVRDFAAAGGSPCAPLFAAPGKFPGPRATSRWLRQALARLGASPPVGVRWSGKSLRSGVAAAANAIGVPVPVAAAYMEHFGPAVTARHYIDARLLPSAAAWEFFGRYISDWSGFPGPARKGGYG